MNPKKIPLTLWFALLIFSSHSIAYGVGWREICQVVWPKSAPCESVAKAFGQQSVCRQIYFEDAQIGDAYLFVSVRGNVYEGRIRKMDIVKDVPVFLTAESKKEIREGHVEPTRLNFGSIQPNGVMREGDFVSLRTSTGRHFEGWVKAWGVQPNGSYVAIMNSELKVQHIRIQDINLDQSVVTPRKTRGPPKVSDPVLDKKLTLLAKLPPSEFVMTRRESELPYRQPKDLQIFNERNPIDLHKLELDVNYLFTIDVDGSLRVAREVNPDYNRRLKHGDLQPANYDSKTKQLMNSENGMGQYRGEARIGGDFQIVLSQTGQRVMVMDLNSSYAFNRADLFRATSESYSSNLKELMHLYSYKDALIQLRKKI